MKISIPLIIILVSVALAIVFACLIAVWTGFGIFLGLSLLVASGTFTFVRYQKHKALKSEIDNQRYCDAYMYADENNLNFDVEHFSYSKKEERAIKTRINNSLIYIIAGVAIMSLSIALIVISATNIA